MAEVNDFEEARAILSTIDENFVLSRAQKVSEKHIQGVLEYSNEILSKVRTEQILSMYERDVKLLLALIEDFITGTYTDISSNSIAIAAFALLYIYSPNDLIPDSTPVYGYMDDKTVLDISSQILRRELKDYDEWLFKFGQY